MESLRELWVGSYETAHTAPAVLPGPQDAEAVAGWDKFGNTAQVAAKVGRHAQCTKYLVIVGDN